MRNRNPVRATRSASARNIWTRKWAQVRRPIAQLLNRKRHVPPNRWVRAGGDEPFAVFFRERLKPRQLVRQTLGF
jgi:hypothetical protein